MHFGGITQAADSAFRAARGSQADVFAARSAVILLEDRLSQIDRQSRNAGLMLARWVGAPDAERPLSGAPPWQTTPLQSAVSSEHLKQHPDLLAVSAEVDTAETDARLAQANKRADWSVEASYAQRGPAYSNMVSIGVSIPLQWDLKNRQDRELAAKLAMVDEAKARYEDTLRSHEAEVRGWLAAMVLPRHRPRGVRMAGVPAVPPTAQAGESFLQPHPGRRPG